MIDALRRGHIDAVVDDEPAFGGLIDDPELGIAFTVSTANRWGAAMRPGSIELKTALDTALAQSISDGQLRRIWRDWLGHIEYPALESSKQ